jgi:hypothetical protein
MATDRMPLLGDLSCGGGSGYSYGVVEGAAANCGHSASAWQLWPIMHGPMARDEAEAVVCILGPRFHIVKQCQRHYEQKFPSTSATADSAHWLP